MDKPVRIGILGAARINRAALIRPAANVPQVEVAAIAARDKDRAEKQARKFGVPKVFGSYADLLADRDIDAVYIPLPNGLHCEWTIRALEAGKHVLCEKPIANNADEAAEMAAAAERTGLVLAEAMHLRYHAIHERLAAILEAGTLGSPRHAEAHVCFIIANKKDIRWQFSLGGGALMDLGVYAVMNLRRMAREEPEVVEATAKVGPPNVDRWIDARMRFPSGATGRVLTSMWGRPIVDGAHFIDGSDAKLVLNDRIGLFNKIDVYKDGRRVSREKIKNEPSTYERQLVAFALAVQNGEPMLTGPDHFIPNMRVIDAIYRAAGLPARGKKE